MKANYQVYDEMYKQARQARWEGWGGNERMSNAILVERFLRLDNAPKKGRIIELGCGEGHHCRALSQLGFEVTGVDISPTAIAWAIEKSNTTGTAVKYFVADLTEEDFKLPEKYGAVIDGNCLHCIIGFDRVKFLHNVRRAIVQGGSFFVSSLCSKGDDSYQTYQAGTPYRHIPSQRSLLTELKQAGFKLISLNIYERETVNHITVHVINV